MKPGEVISIPPDGRRNGLPREGNQRRDGGKISQASVWTATPAVDFAAAHFWGAYPRDFIKWACQVMQCNRQEVFHLCSGALPKGEGAMRVDIRPEVLPDLVADARALPLADGCAAAVRRWGGVLEHPAYSHAWEAFELNSPPQSGGWIRADFHGGWTCYVEQGFYGHFSRKPTWLYAVADNLPSLHWGIGEQRLHPVALAKHGYAKAVRIGMVAMVGGKNKTRIRNATPLAFRDLLLSIASSSHNSL